MEYDEEIVLTPKGEHPGKKVKVTAIPAYPAHWWRFILSSKRLSIGEAIELGGVVWHFANEQERAEILSRQQAQ